MAVCTMDKFVANHWHWKHVNIFMLQLKNFVCHLFMYFVLFID